MTRASVRFGKRRFPLPGSRPVRIALGSILIVFGIFGFLPILGFWMVPAGVLVLSADVGAVRRFRRRIEIWWGRRRQKPAPGSEVSSE